MELFRQNKKEDDNKQQKDINDDSNNFDELNNLNRIEVPIENKEKNNLKVMEKVQEENEDNISNSEIK